MLLVALGAAGCDQLGNPPPQSGVTATVRWESPAVVLDTRTESVPASRFDEVVRALPPGSVHHLERPNGGVVTLTVVQPHWRQRLVPAVVPVVTELALANGSVVRRRWSAPSSAPTWYAVFAVPSLPTTAATTLAP